MGNVSDKVVEETITHILFSKFFSENRPNGKIMLKNTVKPDRPQMTI